jgi:hypothetical protein
VSDPAARKRLAIPRGERLASRSSRTGAVTGSR